MPHHIYSNIHREGCLRRAGGGVCLVEISCIQAAEVDTLDARAMTAVIDAVGPGPGQHIQD